MTQDNETDNTMDAGLHPLRRRRFLMASGIGAVLLAGCTGMQEPGAEESPTAGDDAQTGIFRLLISDRPNAIDDFDELNVTFDEARVFPGAEQESEPEPTPTPTPNETETLENDPEEEKEQNRGFFMLDLEGETVDLTEVIGERAIGVFEGELDAGEYQKIELFVESVEGILTEGGTAGVTVPSEKLQIVHPFEIEPDETVSFVFDINVVARGNTGEYNLLPVVADRGVAGEDVEVEEVDPDEDSDE